MAQICNCSPGVSVGEGGVKKKQLSQSQRRGPGQTSSPEIETCFQIHMKQMFLFLRPVVPGCQTSHFHYNVKITALLDSKPP